MLWPSDLRIGAFALAIRYSSLRTGWRSPRAAAAAGPRAVAPAGRYGRIRRCVSFSFKPERIEHAAVIGVPFGDPARRIAERVGGEHQAHGGGAGRKHLLPFGDLHVRAGAAHHRDHQRRARQPRPLGLGVLRLGVGILAAEGAHDRLAGGEPRLALKDNEAPGHELAVVGHPRRDRQQGLDLGCRRPRRRQLDRLDRAASFQQLQSVGHVSSYPG